MNIVNRGGRHVEVDDSLHLRDIQPFKACQASKEHKKRREEGRREGGKERGRTKQEAGRKESVTSSSDISTDESLKLPINKHLHLK